MNIITPLQMCSRIDPGFWNSDFYNHPSKLPKFEAYGHRDSGVMDAQRLLPAALVYSLVYKDVNLIYKTSNL